MAFDHLWISTLLYLTYVLSVDAQLQIGFYSGTCANAESIVRQTVQAAFIQNPRIAPGILRVQFHDCFVRGCDGSILIDGSDAEKSSPPNLTLEGFEVIDTAKSILEAACPQVVSCADILAFAARDSVVLTGGPTWQVPAGRRDGTVSLKSEPTQFLPPPSSNAQSLTQLFAAQQLSQDDMVTLSGAHTIGVAHCSAFINRLYNFSSSAAVDPTLSPVLAATLQQQCPQGNPNAGTVVSMDPFSPFTFDNDYYANLILGRGLFSSDQTLFGDSSIQTTVLQNSINGIQWRIKFAAAMIKMSSIGVKTGTEGQIRTNCRIVNT
eukprot:c2691_g1_i2 orf=279-1244(+)